MTSPVAKPQDVLLGLIQVLAIACCLFVLPARVLATQQGQQNAATHYVIERLDFVGNRRVESGTLRVKVSSGPGQPYKAEQVERDAQALRDTGFFDEVRAEVTDSPDQANAKIVAFYLRERPIIRRIEYRGIRSINEQDLLRAYEEQKIGLSVKAYFDQARAERAAAVIKDLLGAHGYPSATIKPTYERIAATNAVKIVFNVEEGQRPKVLSCNLPQSGNSREMSGKPTNRSIAPNIGPSGYTPSVAINGTTGVSSGILIPQNTARGTTFTITFTGKSGAIDEAAPARVTAK